MKNIHFPSSGSYAGRSEKDPGGADSEVCGDRDDYSV